GPCAPPAGRRRARHAPSGRSTRPARAAPAQPELVALPRGTTAFAGAPPSGGGFGGPFEAPGTRSEFEGRHGLAGAPPSSGGFGGPFEAPHLTKTESAAGSPAPPLGVEARGARRPREIAPRSREPCPGSTRRSRPGASDPTSSPASRTR